MALLVTSRSCVQIAACVLLYSYFPLCRFFVQNPQHHAQIPRSICVAKVLSAEKSSNPLVPWWLLLSITSYPLPFLILNYRNKSIVHMWCYLIKMDISTYHIFLAVSPVQKTYKFLEKKKSLLIIKKLSVIQ